MTPVATLPRVSVVLPTHDRLLLLREAVDSVQAQTMAHWELIVVDDASMPPVAIDSTDPRIRVIRHPQAQGGAAAKNSGAAQARGEVLAFLDDDDLYDPRYLDGALAVLDAHPELDVVFMGVSWFGARAADGERNYRQAMARFLAQAGGLRKGELSVFGPSLVGALLTSVPMALQRPVVRRAAFEGIGNYRPDCLLWDCDWAIEAALHARCALLHEGLYRQRVDGQGFSSRHDRAGDHLRSGVGIKQRLWSAARSGGAPYGEFREPIRQSAAQAWFDLAWHLYGQRRRGPALRALIESLRLRPQGRHLKLLLRLGLPAR